ncbi:helix-turn-helix domain-containing protein [Halospeciosus flavus]|uniref:Multiprotein-bridging factor 1 family protein n=1 Tax=Halospeciosus flavus TaxID=3032283 RepID=A0ABD5Z1G5_9EURY|nr:multiprotein-bridging factor 1 family protein [Halospeciosus flavus]
MAKYSTGGSSGDADSGTCELCGASSDSLVTATVAGAELNVCSDCVNLDETPKTQRSRTDSDEQQRKRQAAQNTAQTIDAGKPDSSHWEEGADYDSDQLPYLVSGYGEKVREARQEAGYQLDELAEELGLDENDLLAVEQGRATQAGVGGSVVEALEERLDLTLTE